MDHAIGYKPLYSATSHYRYINDKPDCLYSVCKTICRFFGAGEYALSTGDLLTVKDFGFGREYGRRAVLNDGAVVYEFVLSSNVR